MIALFFMDQTLHLSLSFEFPRETTQRFSLSRFLHSYSRNQQRVVETFSPAPIIIISNAKRYTHRLLSYHQSVLETQVIVELSYPPGVLCPVCWLLVLPKRSCWNLKSRLSSSKVSISTKDFPNLVTFCETLVLKLSLWTDASPVRL